MVSYHLNGTKKPYPSAPLEIRISDPVTEHRLENKLIDVNSLNLSISNIKEKIIYFKDRTHKSKQKYKF